MVLVTKMLERTVRDIVQGNVRNTRDDPQHILPDPLQHYARDHIWQCERIHPRRLLQSSAHDGKGVDRGDEESDSHLCCGEEGRETGGQCIGSDGAALGLGMGRDGPDFGEGIDKDAYVAENDEQFK